jgi:hypothetical protein
MTDDQTNKTDLDSNAPRKKKSEWLLTAHGGSEGLSGKAETLEFSESPWNHSKASNYKLVVIQIKDL